MPNKRTVYGYPIREPYPSEHNYFFSNPHVSGMATEDNSIILNPYSGLSRKEQEAVAQNEAARLFLKQNNFNYDFTVTPEQQGYFQNTEYAKPGNERALQETVLGRIISGDPSVGEATPEQQAWAAWIKSQLEAR